MEEGNEPLNNGVLAALWGLLDMEIAVMKKYVMSIETIKLAGAQQWLLEWLMGKPTPGAYHMNVAIKAMMRRKEEGFYAENGCDFTGGPGAPANGSDHTPGPGQVPAEGNPRANICGIIEGAGKTGAESGVRTSEPSA